MIDEIKITIIKTGVKMRIHDILNTKIENTGSLSAFGDALLTPYRALLNGKTVEIISDKTEDPTIQEKKPAMMHKAVAVLIALTVLPIFIGAICKLMAYAFSDVRKQHIFVQKNMNEEKVLKKYIDPTQEKVEPKNKTLEDFVKNKNLTFDEGDTTSILTDEDE